MYVICAVWLLQHSDEASSDVSDDFETETDAVSGTCGKLC